jgi:hypothetical protein
MAGRHRAHAMHFRQFTRMDHISGSCPVNAFQNPALDSLISRCSVSAVFRLRHGSWVLQHYKLLQCAIELA